MNFYIHRVVSKKNDVTSYFKMSKDVDILEKKKFCYHILLSVENKIN